MSEAEVKDITEAKEELSKKLENGTVEDIKSAVEKLTEKFHTMSTKLYEAAQQAQTGENVANNPTDGQAGTSQGKDNVVDADYEVVDDKESK